MGLSSHSSDQEPTLSIIPMDGMVEDGAREPQPTLATWSVSVADDPTLGSSAAPDRALQQGRVSAIQPSQSAYHLLSEVARGGMGEVWEAEQVSLGRRVAVKRLRARGNDGDRERREVEFRQEAFVAASLEHPNVVPIHDLGADESGSPLMAMKMVEGKAWNKLIEADFPVMPEEEFLSRHIPILMSMTQAVAFAHSRGVVHRDLKPSQVLVGSFGEVLLADWGLAIEWKKPETLSSRFANARRWMPTPVTASNPAGTPSLMAPEQTRSDCSGIGPWTDIYLIGSTLYYLLTGTFPHTGKTAAEAMTRAAIGEVESPSKRAPKLRVPEDLEDICLRSLQRDPADRPQSATEIWQALDDHVRGTARRAKSRELSESARNELTKPGIGYGEFNAILASIEESQRLWPDNPQCEALKSVALSGSTRQAVLRGDLALARLQAEGISDSSLADDALRRVAQAETRARHRRLFLRASGAIVVALLAVIATGSVMFSRRMSAKNQQLEERTREAERNLAIATTQGDGAFEVINFILKDLKTAMDGQLTIDRGLTIPVANEISHAIAGQVASPVMGYFEGTDDRAWPDELRLERADQMRETAGRFNKLGRYDEALRLLRPAIDTREALSPGNREEVADWYDELGGILMDTAQLESARESLVKSLEIRQVLFGPDHPETAQSLGSLGTCAYHLGKYEEARSLLGRAIEIAERTLGKDHHLVGEFLDVYGVLLLAMGDSAGARSAYERAIPILQNTNGPKDSATTQCLLNYGILLISIGEYEEARKVLSEVLVIRQEIAGPEHPSTAIVMTHLATITQALGERAEAASLLRRAVEIDERMLGPEHPQTAEALGHLANHLMEEGNYAEALSLHERALAILEKAVGQQHFQRSYALANVATVLMHMGEYQRAKEFAERALQESIKDGTEIVPALFRLATIEYDLGEFESSRDHVEKAINLYGGDEGDDPSMVAGLYGQLARTSFRLGDFEKANSLSQRTIAILEKLYGPDHPEVAVALNDYGSMLQDRGELEQALPILERARALLVLHFGPTHPHSIAMNLNIASLISRQGDLEGARALYESAFKTASENLSPEDPIAKSARMNLFIHLEVMTDAAVTTDTVRAARLAKEGLEIISGHEDLLESDPMFRAALALMYIYAGRLEEARPIVKELRDEQIQMDTFWPVVRHALGPDAAPQIPEDHGTP